jgi:hypothetical protein
MPVGEAAFNSVVQLALGMGEGSEGRNDADQAAETNGANGQTARNARGTQLNSGERRAVKGNRRAA